MCKDGIVDIINALPTSKLLSTVSAGIGKLYEPIHIKRMAKAKAEEIKLISGAMEESSVVPIQYNNEHLSMDTLDWEDFAKRTQGRMVFQELLKQNNIECVVANAYNILENESSCSEEPVEQGWLNSFFDAVSNVSDEDLHELWGKILAGEILQPKTYSLRTLETLKNLSKHEAELFERIAPLVSKLYGSLFLTSETEILSKYGITYDSILLLDECGLINSDGMVSLNPKISTSDTIAILCNDSLLMLLKGLKEEKSKISFGVFGLTSAGKELYSILNCLPNENYIRDLAEIIEKDNKGKVEITIHQMCIQDNGDIRVNGTVLHKFPKNSEE